jgi:hypothetical protein
MNFALLPAVAQSGFENELENARGPVVPNSALARTGNDRLRSIPQRGTKFRLHRQPTEVSCSATTKLNWTPCALVIWQ